MTVKEQIKHTGATFTPRKLADYLSEKILKHLKGTSEIRILDPACGAGELLISMAYSLSKSNRDFSLTGFDANADYLSTARKRSLLAGARDCRFVLGDFLEEINLRENQLSLDFGSPESISTVNKFADVIIANPPYVRTQILGSERAQELAKKFNLKGRVDLYYPFLVAMTEILKNGGILGVITSNRYLSTKGGESIRKYLADHYEVIELIDLGDTKLFDAAVLPAIFIGKKKMNKNPGPSNARFLKIYEELNGYQGVLRPAEDVFEILGSKGAGYYKVGTKKYKKSEGILKYDTSSGAPWEMLSDEESQWISVIDQKAAYRISDLFKVRVGIKTTADKVFIHNSWETLGDNQPEEELLKDLISQENIEQWSLSDKVKLRVLYTHYSEEGKKKTIDIDQYARAKKYLLSHEDQLRGRKYVTNAGRQWFEIWVPQNPELWAMPKLVFPDISAIPRFHFDLEGKLVNGNCYWIVAEKEEDIEKLLLIQGIANTKLMTRYHDLVFNNKLYSGRRRYLSQYVERYPVPDINSVDAKQITKLAIKLNAEKNIVGVEKLQAQLENSVAKAFGVSPVLSLD